MKVISVLNHKGGVGKSTISTNLAGYYTNKGAKVMLGDFDVQQSSKNWLTLRPLNAAKILSWDVKDGKFSQPSSDVHRVIIDGPAGIREKSLERLVSLSDKVIIPLKPGIFDMLSTRSFLNEIMTIIKNSKKNTEICVIGNMVDPRTKASEQLLQFFKMSGLPHPTDIRQAQIYVHLAAHGLTIFDNNVFEKETEQWKPLIRWIEAKPQLDKKEVS